MPKALANVVNQAGFSLSVENAVVTSVASVGGMTVIVGVATRRWASCLVDETEYNRRVDRADDDTNEQVFGDDDADTNPFDRIASEAGEEEMKALVFICILFEIVSSKLKGFARWTWKDEEEMVRTDDEAMVSTGLNLVCNLPWSEKQSEIE